MKLCDYEETNGFKYMSHKWNQPNCIVQIKDFFCPWEGIPPLLCIIIGRESLEEDEYVPHYYSSSRLIQEYFVLAKELYIAKPVLSSHHFCPEKVTTKDRWPLIGGIYNIL